MKKTIKGYKAFEKGLKCKNFQYEVGKEYEEEGDIKLCDKGFHFCENPLDVLDYYDLCESEFAEVETDGKIETDGQKTVSNKIKINAKLDLSAFVKASVDFLWEKCDSVKGKIKGEVSSKDYSKLASSGHYSQLASSGHSSKLASSGHYSKLASSGHYSQLASSGHYSQLASSGDYSQLASSGDYSIVAGIGHDNIANGKKGCWIVLAEWVYDEKLNRYIPECVKSEKIDGKKLKEDVYYKLEKGKFKEVN